MSGGSYNYLYYNLQDESQAESDLERMIHAAHELGKNKFAVELREIQTKMREARQKARDMLEPIRAFEWWQSNDYSMEQFDEAFQEYMDAKGSDDEVLDG